ncbi:MAG: hypothetical protein HY248_06580, partial [Fimbriimonas ginsengisoli]|nr:hypothetical protein [Fimbriimonas ginsengisoli]
MTLNEYAAERKLLLHERLKAGLEPHEGEFDAAIFREAKAKGEPQLGVTRYEPRAILLEFIYPDPGGAAIILTVRLDPPERIVFLPVPPWVVETIWQGDIDGSYHFESHARALLREYESCLAETANAGRFGPR